MTEEHGLANNMVNNVNAGRQTGRERRTSKYVRSPVNLYLEEDLFDFN